MALSKPVIEKSKIGGNAILRRGGALTPEQKEANQAIRRAYAVEATVTGKKVPIARRRWWRAIAAMF